MKIFIPILPHPLNKLLSMHWTTRAKYTKKMHTVVNSYLSKQERPELPVSVTFTRVGDRLQDDDSFPVSFKAIRDAIAMWLVPGTISGQADNHPDITWHYVQQTANVENKLQRGIFIEIHKIYPELSK